jgi:RNA polymerase sigma-70 factor (ECF subfamily)
MNNKSEDATSTGNDRHLVERLIAQDATALDEFYRTYRLRILNTARQMVNDEWDAEEVLQDVCWTVFRKANTFRGDGEFWTWVHRVTQNAGRMLLRKRKRVPTPIEESDVESILQSHSDSDATERPEDVANQRFAVERMTAELSRLDPLNQELFQCMEVDGASKEDVAEQLGLSVSAVKARLHRVRKALRIAASGSLLAAS